MNDVEFENKVNRDIDKAKEDVATLREDATTLGEDGVTGLSRIVDRWTDEAKKMVAVAENTFNKGVEGVGHGLSQYNAKVQDVADRVPGDFGRKAAGYPWVTITMSLVFGLLLGALLKPDHRPVG